MKKAILGLLLVILFCGNASAGALFGMIIQEDGMPLAKKRLVIEGNETRTNEFGGYKVELTDGERNLNVVVDDISYTSERIRIYSPKTEQNWRIDSRGKRLIKIR